MGGRGSELVALHEGYTIGWEGGGAHIIQNMVNADFLSRCKAGVILINTSRGKVVHTADLLAALQSGHVGGACLDVFENERPDTYAPEEKVLFGALHALSNVILSPHVAGWTVESKQRLASVLLEKIKAVGKPSISRSET